MFKVAKGSKHARMLAMALLAVALVAVACGPSATPAPTSAPAAQPTSAVSPTKPPAVPTTAAVAPTTAPAAPGNWPAYYPADYAKLVEDSKKESAGLVVYSIMSEKNWSGVVKGFAAKYPWIKLQSMDLGSYEVFERYYSESASNARTADIIVTSAPDAWQEFIAKGELAAYKSAEDDKVPAWSKLAPSIYTVSSDPMVFIWNKAIVKTPPKTMADLAAMVEKDPNSFKGKLTTYDAEKNATGFAIYWFWIKKNGDKGWEILDKLGKTAVAARTSAGSMVDATLSGENSAGFFVSLISVLPKFPQAEPVMGYAMIQDGTPILTRGMGITKKAASPNSAKLLVDYILSAEGQIAWSDGGLTAYRPDVADKATLHLSKLEAQVGAQNLLPFSFDPDLMVKEKKDAFVARWKKAFGR